MRRVLILAAMLGLASPSSLAAQVRLAPGIVIDGKVVVRVFVILHDDETPYYPVTRLQLRFLRSGSDSVVVTTDDAGTVTTLLRPGEYRLQSAREIVWKGARYSWNLPLTVRPGMSSVELREPSDPARPGGARVVMPPAAGQTLPPRVRQPGNARQTAPHTGSDTVRQGFWLNVGLGVGSFACDKCTDRETGLSGNLSLGGTVNPQVLLGAFSHGWTKLQSGTTLTAGTLTAGMRVYPLVASGLFVTAGLGMSGMRIHLPGALSELDTGGAATFGLGWDIRYGGSISVTPYWNGVGIFLNNSRASFSQLGLGITWH